MRDQGMQLGALEQPVAAPDMPQPKNDSVQEGPSGLAERTGVPEFMLNELSQTQPQHPVYDGLQSFDASELSPPVYDQNGYNQYGFERMGYDCDGYDWAGYNRDGFNCSGEHM
jgi:hypothetical protein